MTADEATCGSPPAPGSCPDLLPEQQRRALERRLALIRAVRAGVLADVLAREHGINRRQLSKMVSHLRARATPIDDLAMRLARARTLPMVAFELKGLTKRRPRRAA